MDPKNREIPIYPTLSILWLVYFAGGRFQSNFFEFGVVSGRFTKSSKCAGHGECAQLVTDREVGVAQRGVSGARSSTHDRES